MGANLLRTSGCQFVGVTPPYSFLRTSSARENLKNIIDLNELFESNHNSLDPVFFVTLITF